MNWSEHNLVKNGDVVSVLPWQEFDWLKQGYTLASAGNIDYRFGDASAARKQVADSLHMNVSCWTSMQQVHGSHVEIVEQKDVGKGASSFESGFSDTDAMISGEQNALLTVAVADCVPLLFVDPIKRLVAVAHAGRRGTFAGVAQKTLYQMVKHGSRAQDVQVAIGPSIGPCCYMFDDEPLDLWSLNEQQLRQGGVQTIIRMDLCTKHTDYFFSHQRDPRVGRFAGFTGIT